VSFPIPCCTPQAVAQDLPTGGPRPNARAFLYGRNTANKPQQLPSPFTLSSQADTDLKQFYAQCHETSEKLLELFAMALNVCELSH